MEWRPIETIGDCMGLVSGDGNIAMGHFIDGLWIQYVHGTPMLFQPKLQFIPTHWMPLPEPPEVGDGS